MSAVANEKPGGAPGTVPRPANAEIDTHALQGVCDETQAAFQNHRLSDRLLSEGWSR